MNRMIFAFISFVLLGIFSCFSSLSLASGSGPAGDSVVKIFTASSASDYYAPWTTRFVDNSTGSGTVIAGNRILTNAHVVSDQKFIQIRFNGNPEKYVANVEFVSHSLDLAVLSVEDKRFFVGKSQLDFGDIPKSLESVLVYGYPAGGDSQSVTKGVLSRLEHQEYVHSGLSFFAGQIDAAINPGNSGGPVVADGKLVGVVMQNIPGLDNIGYMVPVNIVKQFLKDIEDGKLDGVPRIGLMVQKMNNKNMRNKYQMSKDQTGLLVIKKLPNPGNNCLDEHDVITKLAGYQIANDGTVEFRHNERTWHSYILEGMQMGDTIDIEYIRAGKVDTCKVKLLKKSRDFLLIPKRIYDRPAKYYIYGGIVFCPLSMNLLDPYNDSDEGWKKYINPDVLAKTTRSKEKENEEVIILFRVLPDSINEGYGDYKREIVTKVNGKTFGNFEEFVTEIKAVKTKYTTFETLDNGQIIIDHKKALSTHDEILKKYLIPSKEL